mgnify:CR=1 FL=1
MCPQTITPSASITIGCRNPNWRIEDPRKHPYETVFTDPGFVYAAEHSCDVSAVKPQVAAPHSVDNVSDLAAHAGRPIDQAFIGTCTGGRLEDLAVAARILAGRKVHPRTRLLVVPASKGVFLEAMKDPEHVDKMDKAALAVKPLVGEEFKKYIYDMHQRIIPLMDAARQSK